MNLQEKFIANWAQHFSRFTPENSALLLAVSGGADSVVLTHLLYKSGFALTIAHCNFKLRGEESVRDENFVKQLATQLDIPVLVKHFDTGVYASDHKVSIQEAARELRYSWFRELIELRKNTVDEAAAARPRKHQLLLTAHHANDNIETLLMHFFRGTGISGLHGIPLYQGNTIRPLLFALKEEILSYAQHHGLRWVEDSSNASDKYSRNFFRNNVLPMVRSVYPQAEQNLLQNIDRFKDAEILYKQAVGLQMKKLLVEKGNEFHIPLLLLQRAEPLHTIIFELVKPFGFTATQVWEIKKLMDAHNGSYMASPTHRIIRNRKWLIIAPLREQLAAHIMVEAGDAVVNFACGQLLLKSTAASLQSISKNPETAQLDTANIRFPLLLRKYKQGDYFYPLGMNKKKKVSRFLIDLKLSAIQKENVWVLEADKKIIWVIGYRIDNRFRIQPATKAVLEIRFKQA